MNNLNYNYTSGPLPIHWVDNESDTGTGKKIRKMQFRDEKTKEQHLVVVKAFVKKLSDTSLDSISKKEMWVQVQDDDKQIGWAKIDKSAKEFLPEIPKEVGSKVTKNEAEVKHKFSSQSSKPARLFALSLLASSVSGFANASSDMHIVQNNTNPNFFNTTSSSFPEFLEPNLSVAETGSSDFVGFDVLRNIHLPNSQNFSSVEVSPPSTKLSPRIINEEKLREAIKSGDIALVSAMVEAGTDVNQKCEDGSTFLSIAINSGNKDMIVLLHKLGASLTDAGDQEPYLHMAVRSGHIESIDALLELGIPINQKNEIGSTALHIATTIKNVPMIKTLADYGADVNAMDNKGYTALHYAVFAQAATIRTLIEVGTFNKHSKEAEAESFLNPSSNANLDVIDMLISGAKANIDAQAKTGETPLHLAVSIDNVQVVKKLINLGANINALTKTRVTPLYIASASFHREIISILINAGASAKIYNSEGITPSIVCLAYHPNEDCIGTIGIDVFSKQTLVLKELTHAFEIGGFRNIGEKVELEGWFSEIFASSFQTQINAFTGQYPESLNPDEALKLNQILKASIAARTIRLIPDETEKNLEIETRSSLMSKKIFFDKSPTLFHTGFQGHAIEILFQGNYMIICNKGGGSKKPIQMLDISREDLATVEKLVKKTMEISSGSKNAYAAWLKEITEKFSPKENDPLPKLLEQNYPFELAQIVGNCAWESLETALYASLVLDRLGSKFDEINRSHFESALAKTNKDFGVFMAFINVNTLKNYINSFAQENIKALPEGTDASSPEDIAKIDQIVLFKAFKKNKTIKTWDINLGKEIAKIEKDFFVSLSPALKTAYITATVFNVDKAIDDAVVEAKKGFEIFSILYQLYTILTK